MHNGLDPPTSITNQENALQTFLQANTVEVLFQLMSLFSDDSSLCQVDKSPTKVKNKRKEFNTSITSDSSTVY